MSAHLERCLNGKRAIVEYTGVASYECGSVWSKEVCFRTNHSNSVLLLFVQQLVNRWLPGDPLKHQCNITSEEFRQLLNLRSAITLPLSRRNRRLPCFLCNRYGGCQCFCGNTNATCTLVPKSQKSPKIRVYTKKPIGKNII